MLGHRSSTYHDITSTSVEFLRDIYNMAELRISKPTSEAEYRQEIHNGTAAKPGRKAGRLSSTTTPPAEPQRVYAGTGDERNGELRE